MWIKINSGDIVDVSGKVVVASRTGSVKAMDFSGNHFELGRYMFQPTAERIVSDIFEAIEHGDKVYEMPQGVE